MIKSRKQMFVVIGAFLLVLALVTTTYAFFNYTRTGTANVIRTGKISFNANQTETINLTNVFPIDKTTIGTDSVNTDETIITITGDTTYTDGIEYLVTAVDVNNTIGTGNNQKTVPISVSVTASNGLGTEDEEYFDNRENANSHLYRVLAGDVLEENGRIAVGYIKAGSTGVNGTLTIKAYLDKAKIAITDTYDGNESDNMGTTTEWVDNRTVLTTTEWNALQTNGVSFKVKVESNEGIWVEEELSVNAMQYFTYEINTQYKENIKEMYFNKMGMGRMQQAYDAATIKADLTYNNEGKVLAWLEENSDDNTKYNLIIASDGETYLTHGINIFGNFTSLEKVEFNNINTSRLTNLTSMFEGDILLEELDLTNFDTSNVYSMTSMFKDCTNLKNVNISSFNTSSIISMTSMFKNCSSLVSIDLSGMGSDHIYSYSNMEMFKGCTSLKKINMSGYNFGSSSFYGGAGGFNDLPSLEEIDLSNVKMNSMTNMPQLFMNCPSLRKIYVSDDWSMDSITLSADMFNGCTSLVGGNGTTYDESNPKDKTYAIIDGTNGQPGYFTDIADKPSN